MGDAGDQVSGCARPLPHQGLNLGRELGNYRLVGLLGEGGMGNVYVGAHTRLNRTVAIKLLRPELRDRHEAITRFFDEAQTVNRAKHPNIIESLDLVDDPIDVSRVARWTTTMDSRHRVVLRRRLSRLGTFYGYDVDDPVTLTPLREGTPVWRASEVRIVSCCAGTRS